MDQHDNSQNSKSKNSKSWSSIAFISVAILFAVLYYLMKDLSNGLNKAWLSLVVIFILARLYTKYVTRPRLARARALDLGLSAEQSSSNKMLHKFAKEEAGKTYFGELGSYLWIFLGIFLIRAFAYEPFKIPSGSMQPTLEIGDYITVNKYHYRILDPLFQKTLIRRNEVERGDIIVFKSPADPNSDWIKRVIGKGGDIVHYNELYRKLFIISDCKTPRVVANRLFANNNYAESITLTEDEINAGCKIRDTSYGIFSTSKFYAYESYLEKRQETLTRNEGTKVEHLTLQTPRPLNYGSHQDIFHQDGLPNLTWVVDPDHFFVMGDNRDNSKDSRFIGFVPFEYIVGKAEYIWFALKYDRRGESIQGVNFDRIFTNIYNEK